MNFLTVIPARFASTRFPGKPLALLGGKPVIQWVFERAKEASEHVAVATDDARIAETVENFGGIAIMTSPNHVSGTDRCLEAAIIYSEKYQVDIDVVINIQGDEPFIDAEQVKSLQALFDSEKVDIATMVSPFKKDINDITNPNNVKATIAVDGKALYFSRSAIPFCRDVKLEDWAENSNFYHHLGMYAYRFNVLKEITSLPVSSLEKAESLEQLRWLENGYNIYVAKTLKRSIGIDTPEDLAMAESLL